jgi:hypothetical protein
MISTSELMHGHFLWQVQPLHFPALTILILGKYQKSPGLTSMTCNRSKILTGYANFHVFTSL